jgi:hypothetical protein
MLAEASWPQALPLDMAVASKVMFREHGVSSPKRGWP